MRHQTHMHTTYFPCYMRSISTVVVVAVVFHLFIFLHGPNFCFQMSRPAAAAEAAERVGFTSDEASEDSDFESDDMGKVQQQQQQSEHYHH